MKRDCHANNPDKTRLIWGFPILNGNEEMYSVVHTLKTLSNYNNACLVAIVFLLLAASSGTGALGT